MTDSESDRSRRRFLLSTGTVSLVSLAGCLGSGGGDESGGDGGEEYEVDLTMPEGQENCVSLDGIERDPEDLTSKEGAQYQQHPNYRGASGYIEMCANCQFFCPVSPPDKVGACAVVEGGIHSQHWCALWQAAEHVENLDRPSAGTTSGR